MLFRNTIHFVLQKEAFGSRHFCQTISNNVVTKFPHIEFLKKNLTIFAA